MNETKPENGSMSSTAIDKPTNLYGPRDHELAEPPARLPVGPASKPLRWTVEDGEELTFACAWQTKPGRMDYTWSKNKEHIKGLAHLLNNYVPNETLLRMVWTPGCVTCGCD